MTLTSIDQEMQRSGSDLGSPITATPEKNIWIFMPTGSPSPSDTVARAPQNLATTSTKFPTFSESKRGRRDPVVFGLRP